MARVTVEDCIDKVDSPYELVLVAKERAAQLNSGLEPTLQRDNDKNTVIALREIGEGKISIKNVEDSAITKLRKTRHEQKELEELEVDPDDEFDKIYKGEISKSGTAILPSKRVRRIPEKILLDVAEEKDEMKQSKDKVQESEEQESESSETVEKTTE